MLVQHDAVASSNRLRVLDEPRLQHVQGCVRDPVGPETLVEDADLLDVLRLGEAGGHRDGNSIGDGSCLDASSAGTMRGRCGVAEPELVRLGKGQEPVGGLRRHRRLAVGFRDEPVAVLKVLHELLVGLDPRSAALTVRSKKGSRNSLVSTCRLP